MNASEILTIVLLFQASALCIGVTHTGNSKNPVEMAVIWSNGEDDIKYIETSYPNTTYFALTNLVSDSIVTNEDGWGEFRCNGKSVSVWVLKREFVFTVICK